ncbi:hypothetical protein [Acaryochloris sp. IP29b_bin.148]|uniref:hypothetical protein n=1 Tax=Acaryochloris sp. IP29b_bin.148 TaxID=2969218 RepID=UPI0026117B85|nr:hypothetical protein [Acaryochloris sp. IP29b_bin.148]
MVFTNSWFWLAVLMWIVGVGIIVSWLMGKIWFRNQGKLYRWQIWLFRANGVVGGLAGLVIGYQIGEKQPLSQTCEGLAAWGCISEGLANTLIGSLLGTWAGAIVAVVGAVIILKSLKI